MTLEGYGTEQIAASLEQDGILTPRAYWLKKGIKRPGKGKEQPPTKWNSSSVTKILSLQEYCGDILNFKTYSKSYKNKKRLENDRENWVIFKDVHEPIIERAIFEQVQQKGGKIRKRRTHEGERNMFSGLLVCADCGHNLHFHFNQGNPDIKYFNCSNYKGNRGSCTSTHYVRVDFLEQVVLGEIRRLTKFASQFEDEFVKAVIGHSQQAEATDRKLKEKELKACKPAMRSWTACLNGSMRTMFPASSLMTASPVRRGGTRRSKRSWRRKSRRSAPRSTSRAASP